MSAIKDWWERFEGERKDDVGDVFDRGNAGVPCFVGGFYDWCGGKEGRYEGQGSVKLDFLWPRKGDSTHLAPFG